VLLEWPQISKINVGSLGNVVPQLHVHIVGRRVGDASWPGPVWGVGQAEPYASEILANIVDQIRLWLQGLIDNFKKIE
jgi:diadenosine tetraphosphate (Ap4A) HIT family hydrolase